MSKCDKFIQAQPGYFLLTYRDFTGEPEVSDIVAWFINKLGEACPCSLSQGTVIDLGYDQGILTPSKKVVDCMGDIYPGVEEWLISVRIEHGKAR